MNAIFSWLKKNWVGCIVFPLMAYVVLTTRSNETELAIQAKDLTTIHHELDTDISSIHGDMGRIKKSLVSILLDAKLDKSSIIKGLISDSATMKGVELFSAGKYSEAYVSWETSGKKNIFESALIIDAADAALRTKLKDPTLDATERAKIEAVLDKTKNPQFHDDVYHWNNNG